MNTDKPHTQAQGTRAHPWPHRHADTDVESSTCCSWGSGPPDLCLQHHTPLSSLSVWSGIAVTLRSKSRGAQKKPRLIPKSSLQPQVASLTAQSWGSAEERREVDRHGLNSAACLFQICTGNQRTEAYGFGGPEDKTFPEGPPFWERQSLGKDAWGGRGRIYGISPPAGNKGRFLRPA